MSADNWAICPKCKKESKKKPKIIYREACEKEYLESLKEAEELAIYSLREDYDIRIDEAGEFYIQYSAHCEICGFDKQFNLKENLLS